MRKVTREPMPPDALQVKTDSVDKPPGSSIIGE